MLVAWRLVQSLCESKWGLWCHAVSQRLPNTKRLCHQSPKPLRKLAGHFSACERNGLRPSHAEDSERRCNAPDGCCRVGFCFSSPSPKTSRPKIKAADEQWNLALPVEPLEGVVQHSVGTDTLQPVHSYFWQGLGQECVQQPAMLVAM